MQKIILLFLFYYGIVISNAQALPQDTSRIFSEPQLKQDWSIFRKALTESHPAIYRYTSKEKFDHFFDRVNTSFTHSLTEEEFVKLLMKGVALVRCVHTSAGFSEEFYKIHTLQKRKILPLNFRFINGRAYISKNASRDCISNLLGLEVKAINGKPMQYYIDEFYPLQPGD